MQRLPWHPDPSMSTIPTIIFALFLTSSLWVFPKTVEAACNFYSLMTATTKNISNFTSTCTITAAEGVDNPVNVESSTTNSAAITLGSGSAVTINNGGSLITNSLVLNGGTLAIQTGGQARINAPLYVADADADGWPDSWTMYTATASGRRRLGLMRSFGSLDCNAASYSATNTCCTVATRYQDADGDGYGNPLSSISACPTAGYVDNNSDCNDTGTNAANVYVTASCYVDSDNDDYGSTTAKTCTNNATCGTATWASGGAGTAAASGNFASNSTDCHETGTNAALVWSSTTCYIDIDNDNYTNGSQTCTNNATCASATSGSTGNGTTVVSYTAGNLQSTTGAGNTDCYDANAATTNAELAYPGSATCSTASRGDGSYDYNCTGGGVACGTTYYNTVWTCLERANLQAGCPCQKEGSKITTPVSCGVVGYTMFGYGEVDNPCGFQYYWTPGTSGTQACQ